MFIHLHVSLDGLNQVCVTLQFCSHLTMSARTFVKQLRIFFISLQSNMTMKLMIEVERALTGSTRLKRILFDCCWLVSWATVTGYLERCGITIGRANVCKLLFPGSTHDCNNACNMRACSHVCGTVHVHSQFWRVFTKLKGD